MFYQQYIKVNIWILYWCILILLQLMNLWTIITLGYNILILYMGSDANFRSVIMLQDERKQIWWCEQVKEMIVMTNVQMVNVRSWVLSILLLHFLRKFRLLHFLTKQQSGLCCKKKPPVNLNCKHFLLFKSVNSKMQILWER